MAENKSRFERAVDWLNAPTDARVRREAQQKVDALKRAGVPNVAVREATQEVVGVTADGREVDVTPTGTIRPTTRMADAVASGDILVEELATTTTEDFGTEEGKKKTNFMLKIKI